MEPKWVILCGLLVLPAALTIGLIWLESRNFRLRSWRQTHGRIVASASEARDVHKIESETAGSDQSRHFVSQETMVTRNFAMLRYEFEANGRTYSGSRVDLAAEHGDFEVADTLRRYPEGKIVEVYYDPENPEHCVLERLDRSKLRAGCLAVVFLVALIFGGVFGGDRIVAGLRAGVPRPDNAPFVAFLGFFALALLGFAHAIAKKGRAMATWPSAPGEIVKSEVATTIREDSGPSRTEYQTMYAPRVVFFYVVDRVAFQGDNIGAIIKSGDPAGPTTFITRFPLGMRVTVFYNPADAAESTLTIKVGYSPIVLRVLAVMFVFAATAVAGFVPGL